MFGDVKGVMKAWGLVFGLKLRVSPSTWYACNEEPEGIIHG